MSAGDAQRTAWSAFPLELLEPAEMAEADRLTHARVPGTELMERAGEAIAEAVLRRAGARSRVVILCGPGNNGGDGYVAARLLLEAGCEVTISALVARDKLTGDAAAAAAHWAGSRGAHPDTMLSDPAQAQAMLNSADIVVDALFGAGLSRDLDGPAKAIVEATNAFAKATGRAVVSADIPSGTLRRVRLA